MVEVLWLEGTFWRLAVKIWQVYFLCLAPWVLFSAGLILIFCRGGLCFSLMNIILLLRKISQAQWKTECVKLWLKPVCQAVLFAWFSNVAVHLPLSINVKGLQLIRFKKRRRLTRLQGIEAACSFENYRVLGLTQVIGGKRLECQNSFCNYTTVCVYIYIVAPLHLLNALCTCNITHQILQGAYFP